MAKYTENYNLEKPDKTEYYDIETANKNNDIIDARLFEKQDKQVGKGLSTNDFTDEYKKKIDALQRIYKYCGSVETVVDLDAIEERQTGDVYNVKDTNIDYCWNGIEWTELGNAVDLTNYQTTEQANQDKQEIQDNLVVVSATEPIGDDREKVWIQKGKNLFNAETDIELIGSFRHNRTGEIQENSSFYGIKKAVEGGKTYITNSNLTYSTWSNLCFFDSDMNFIFGTPYNTLNKSFTTPENCAYVTIAVPSNYMWFSFEEYISKIYVLNDNGVYEEFINANNLCTKTETIWSGNHYTTGSDNTQLTHKIFEVNKLYIFVVKGNSGTFNMSIPYIHGSGNSIQYAYYDGTSVTRWRIIINSTSTGFYLDNDSLNMGSNTGVLKVIEVN